MTLDPKKDAPGMTGGAQEDVDCPATLPGNAAVAHDPSVADADAIREALLILHPDGPWHLSAFDP